MTLPNKETEPKGGMLGFIFEALLQQADNLVAQNANANREEILRKLIADERRKLFEDPTKQVVHYSAQRFREKLTDNRPGGQRAEAQNDAQGKAYSKAQLDQSKDLLSASRAVAQAEGDQLPGWLKVDVELNPANAVFAARMATLPPELRDNPDVVLQGLSELYNSTSWNELSLEAHKETRAVMDQALEFVHSQQNQYRVDNFYDIVSPRFNLYRTERLDLIDVSVEPAEKDSPEHKVWKEQKLHAQQRELLDKTLVVYQRQLDSPANGDVENQADILGKMINELITGQTRTVTDREVDVLVPKYSSEAQRFIDKAQERKNALDQVVELRKEARNTQQRATNQLREARERMQVFTWTEEYAKSFPGSQFTIGEEVTLPATRGGLKKKDIEMVLEGFDGQRRWLAEFRDKETSPMKPYKPNIYAEGELHDFEDAVRFLWGENTSVPKFLKEFADSFEDIDAFGKAINTRPSGKKVEEFTQAMRYLTADKLEMLRQIELAEIATPHYTEGINDLLDQVFQKKAAVLRELLEEVDNPFQMLLNDRNNPRAKTILNHKDTPKTARDARITKNDLHKLYTRMAEKVSAANPYGELTEDQFKEYRRLDTMVALVEQGVILREHHMIPANPSVHLQLTELQNKYFDVGRRIAEAQHVNAPAAEIQILVDGRDKLGADFSQKVDVEYTYGFYDINIGDVHTLRSVRNLSPVEMIVRERTIDTVRDYKIAEGWTKEETNKWLMKNEWKVYESIFAARNITLGTGGAMEISAKRAQSSSLEMKYILGRSPRPQGFMERSWAEPWTRVLNGHLFEDDFNMGGAVGEEMRNIRYTISFRHAGYKLEDVMRDKPNTPADWKRRRALLLKNEAPEWVLISEYAQHSLGLSYSEVVRPEDIATGLTHLGTTWRDERVVLNQIREDFLRRPKPPGAVPDNEALGLQYHIATKEQKPFILEKLIQRELSVFVYIVGRDLHSIVRPSGIDLDTQAGKKEWRLFKRALSVAEKKLWLEEPLLYRNVNLGDQNDFDSLMPKVLQSMGIEPTPDRLASYFQVITEAQKYMRGVGASGKPRLERWVEHNFKNNLLLSFSDFNLKKSDWMKINSFSLQRRVNDFEGQGQARALEKDIYYGHPEQFFYPRAGKEIDAALKQLEFKDAIVGYSGYEAAELSFAVMTEASLEWNFNWASQIIAGWIPGAVSVMKHIPGIEEPIVNLRNGVLWVMEKFPSGKKYVEDHKLRELPTPEWPRTVRAMVSKDVKHGGADGNAWDEFKAGGWLTTIESLKGFRTHEGEKYYNDMMKKYKGNLLGRLRAVPRKYWWAVIVATMAVAATESLEEEKKLGSGGH